MTQCCCPNYRVHMTCVRQDVRGRTVVFAVLINNHKLCKGLPQQAEVAQEVPGKLRPQIFLMFRHYKVGRSSAKRTGRLFPRRNPWYSLSEAESTSGHMVMSGVPRKKSPVTPPVIDPGTVRPVAQRLLMIISYNLYKCYPKT